MNTPQLSAEMSADGLECVLRVDQIRSDTLIQLAQAWADGGRADIEAALDDLAEIVSGDPTDGELDAAVDAVDEAAGMTYPRIWLSKDQTRRLRRDLSKVMGIWARLRRQSWATARPLPTVGKQRNGGAAA